MPRNLLSYLVVIYCQVVKAFHCGRSKSQVWVSTVAFQGNSSLLSLGDILLELKLPCVQPPLQGLGMRATTEGPQKGCRLLTGSVLMSLTFYECITLKITGSLFHSKKKKKKPVVDFTGIFMAGSHKQAVLLVMNTQTARQLYPSWMYNILIHSVTRLVDLYANQTIAFCSHIEFMAIINISYT